MTDEHRLQAVDRQGRNGQNGLSGRAGFVVKRSARARRLPCLHSLRGRAVSNGDLRCAERTDSGRLDRYPRGPRAWVVALVGRCNTAGGGLARIDMEPAQAEHTQTRRGSAYRALPTWNDVRATTRRVSYAILGGISIENLS